MLKKYFSELTNLIKKFEPPKEWNIPNNLNVKKKVLIEPIRLREKYDNLENLLRRKETPILIKKKHDFPQIEFLIHDKQSKLISKINNLDSVIFDINFGDINIKANSFEIFQNPNTKFIHKIVFERYWENTENRLKIKINSKFDTKDEFLKDRSVKRYHKHIHIITSMGTVPKHIDIDLRLLRVKDKILFKDIEEMLPYGIRLDKEIHKNMLDHIIKWN